VRWSKLCSQRIHCQGYVRNTMGSGRHHGSLLSDSSAYEFVGGVVDAGVMALISAVDCEILYYLAVA